METTFTFTQYGAAATEALAAAVSRAKAGAALTPVTVIVPSNLVGVSARRALATQGGLAAVRFDTLLGVARLLAAPALTDDSRIPVSDPVVAAAVRATLAKSADLLKPVARHPATERAMVRVHRELRELDDETLDALSTGHRHAQEIVRIHRLTHQRLTTRYFDEVDLNHAAQSIAASGHPALEPLGSVVVYLPGQITNSGLGLLTALANQNSLAVIAGYTGDPTADQPTQLVVEHLGGAFTPPQPKPLTEQLSVCSLADPDEEARMAVRQIVAAAAQGTSFARMAIAHPGTDHYASLLHQHLRSAGLTFNGVADRRLSESIAGRTLLALLELSGQDFSRSAVMALVSSGAIFDGDDKKIPSAQWERLSRQAGVTSGLEQWERRLNQYRADQEQDKQNKEAAGLDPSTWSRFEENTTQAKNLTTFVHRLAEAVNDIEPRSSWPELTAWAEKLLKQYLAPATARPDWPEAETEALSQVTDLLRSLSRLHFVEATPGLTTFYRAVSDGLDRGLDRSGRFGEGVLVGGLSVVAGLDLDLVIVVGLAEGITPTRRRDDPLLPDVLRRSTNGSLPIRNEHQAQLHHNLLAVLASAPQQVLIFPRGDLGAKTELVPSRWLLDQVEAKTGTRPAPEDLEKTTSSWFQTFPSFVGSLHKLDFPLNHQEYALAELLRHQHTGGQLLTSSRLNTDQILSRGARLISQRNLDTLTEFDGRLTSKNLPTPADGSTIVSATRLQSWVKCPYAYFVEHILKVKAPLEPNDEERINPLDRGTLAHHILERFIKDGLEAGDLPAHGEAWNQQHRQRLHALCQEEFTLLEDRGLAGQPLLWKMESQHLLRALEAFLIDDNLFRKSTGATPLAAELGFGVKGLTPYVHTLPDGRQIRFRGMIDRVDQTQDGHLIISDYKTGQASYYKKVTVQNPDVNGQYLQLPLYGLAARAQLKLPESNVHAQYWFLTDGGKMQGHPLTAEVLDRFDYVLGVIANSIQSGLFPARPDKDDRYGLPCHYCNPDGLGTTSSFDRWVHKKEDPALDVYRSLIGDLENEEIAATVGLEKNHG